MENDLSKWLRIRRLVARNVCPMGKPAKANLERIVYKLEHQRETHIVHGRMESRNDCQPKKETTQTLQTICHERSGDAVAKKVCVSVYLQLYLYT